jgi:hypothetical protein
MLSEIFRIESKKEVVEVNFLENKKFLQESSLALRKAFKGIFMGKLLLKEIHYLLL